MSRDEVWIFGYGSLIFDPEYNGQKLEDFCEPPIDGVIEEGIEFWHTSKSRGGAPTLCFDGTKRRTKGKCWKAVGVLKTKAAIDYLRKREGKIRDDLKVTLADGRTVEAYCGDTFPDLKGRAVQEIAAIAVQSEKEASSGRGGVTYIEKCKEIGITTPMTEVIINEIEKLTRGEK